MDSERTYISSDTHHQRVSIPVVSQKAFLYLPHIGTATGTGENQHISCSWTKLCEFGSSDHTQTPAVPPFWEFVWKPGTKQTKILFNLTTGLNYVEKKAC